MSEGDAHLAVDRGFARHRGDVLARVGVVRGDRSGLGERAVAHRLVRRFEMRHPRRSSRRGVRVRRAGDVPAVVGRRVAPLALSRARRRRGHRAVHAPPLRQARRHAGGTPLLRLHRARFGGTRAAPLEVTGRPGAETEETFCCFFARDVFNSRLDPQPDIATNGFFGPLQETLFGSFETANESAHRDGATPQASAREARHARRDAVVPRPRAR